jgi:hypothetical protein
MKIISIDIGVKNFAYCIFDTDDTNTIHINSWNTIDLSNSIKCLYCDDNAIYSRDSEYYCKTHAKTHSIYNIPPKDLVGLSLKSKPVLKSIMDKYKIILPNINTKKDILIYIIEEYKSLHHYFDIVHKVQCNNINLISLGRLLTINLDLLPIVDVVLIENQLGPSAVRMRCIQCMVMQYYILKGVDNIQFISAKNKLSHWQSSNTSISYNEKKTMGVDITNKILQSNKQYEDWYTYFITNRKKKDDLADCFLQGVWYINTKVNHMNKICLS